MSLAAYKKKTKKQIEAANQSAIFFIQLKIG